MYRQYDSVEVRGRYDGWLEDGGETASRISSKPLLVCYVDCTSGTDQNT